MMTLFSYSGEIKLSHYGEAYDVLFISDIPLAEFLLADIAGHQVSVRYWISSEPAPKSSLQAAAINTLLGIAEVEFEARYSEYTGYLWTDEEIKIGGHDLLRELSSSVGKWVHLEIEREDS